MSLDKQDNQSPQEQRKEDLKLAISEIHTTQPVGTCASATYGFDTKEMFKKVEQIPQIMARVSPYNPNETNNNPIKKADIDKLKRVFGF